MSVFFYPISVPLCHPPPLFNHDHSQFYSPLPPSCPPSQLLFQMFEDLFSGSGAEGSGLSSELYSGLGSGFSSGFISEAGFASGFGLELGSAWVSGEVYCLGLLGEPINTKKKKKKAELQSKTYVLRLHHLIL